MAVADAYWLGGLPAHNVTLADTVGTLVAVVAFASVLYAPGYVLGFASNVFGFRRQGFGLRSLLAIACSFMVAPIAAHLVGRVAGLGGVSAAALVAAAVAIVLLGVRRSGERWVRRDVVATALIGCGWMVFVLLMLVDFQRGHKLYFSVVMADQSYRIAFTDALARTGIPPANPLYFAGSRAAMHYYYFWYILCAVVMKVGHVTARQAFNASTIWAGFGLMATVRLFGTHFFAWTRRYRWVALGLLGVMGADILPSVGNAILQPCLNGDIEWWSVDPVDAWPDSLLWVPHHVASALCCLLGFLFVWRMREGATQRQRLWVAMFSAAAIASAFGLSVYVTCGFGMMLAAWLLWLAWKRNAVCGYFVRQTVVAGLAAGVMLVPFVLELVRSLPKHGVEGAAGVGAPHLFVLSVRRMIDSELVTGMPVLAGWKAAHPLLLDQGVRLLLLVPGLAMELGVYGAVLVLLLRARRRRSGGEDFARETALFFVVSGLIITMFVSSSVISNNDFGYRAIMVPQFFLLLLTADVFAGWSGGVERSWLAETPLRRRLLRTLVLVGVAGTIYGAGLLRVWLPLEERTAGTGFSQSASDAYDVREAFGVLDRVAARDAVIAFQPIDPTVDRRGAVMTPFEYLQRSLVMDSRRQILNAEGKCATHFGGSPAPCAAIQQQTAALYGVPSPDAEWATEFCGRFGVQYLVLTHRDAAWEGQAGWPVMLPVVASEPGLHIVACRPGAAQQAMSF